MDQRYAKDKQIIYQKYAQDIINICQRCTQNMPVICPRYACDHSSYIIKQLIVLPFLEKGSKIPQVDSRMTFHPYIESFKIFSIFCLNGLNFFNTQGNQGFMKKIPHTETLNLVTDADRSTYTIKEFLATPILRHSELLFILY